MRKKLAVTMLLVAICSMPFVGCKRSEKSPAPTGPVDPLPGGYTFMEKIPVSNNLMVDVFLDGTYSMSGYVNKGNASVYKTVIKDLEVLFHNRWSSSKVNFIKFGDKYVSLDSNEKLLKFEREDFYQDVDTRLDNVIAKTDNEKLNVIVTDLFQTNSFVQSLSVALKDKCFGDNSGRSFAIIGLKSQFKGKIYDIANGHPDIEYASTDDNEKTYRPFYMMVIGSDNDVKVFAYEFQRKYPKALVSLFTKEHGNNSSLALGAGAGSTRNGFVNLDTIDGKLHFKVKAKGVSQDELVLHTNKLPISIGRNYIVEVGKLEKESGGSGFSLKNPASLLSRDKKKGEMSEVQNEKFISGVGTLQSNPTYVIDSNEGAKAVVNLSLKANGEAVEEGKYRVNLTALPKRDEYVNAQDVFKDWNFDEDKVPESNAEIGAKTQSISSFTRNVAEKHYMTDKPGFRNFDFYLDVK